MGNKKKKKATATDIKPKYPSKVEERLKKLQGLDADGDQELWKFNEKRVEDFMRFGNYKKSDKLPPKVANRLRAK